MRVVEVCSNRRPQGPSSTYVVAPVSVSDPIHNFVLLVSLDFYFPSSSHFVPSSDGLSVTHDRPVHQRRCVDGVSVAPGTGSRVCEILRSPVTLDARVGS